MAGDRDYVRYARLEYLDLCFFFFSSRRRHTRLQGDWSSDVCSSDLSLRMTIGRFTTEEEIDYAISTIRTNVVKLRELSPLWEMFKDGIDLSTIQWAAH